MPFQQSHHKPGLQRYTLRDSINLAHYAVGENRFVDQYLSVSLEKRTIGWILIC